MNWNLPVNTIRKRLELDSDQIRAHRGLSYVLREFGDEIAAEHHRDRGFRDHCIISLPYRGKSQPIRVLQLISAAGGNMPIDQFLDDTMFSRVVVAMEYFDINRPLPPHDLVINCIANADLSTDGAGRGREDTRRNGRTTHQSTPGGQVDRERHCSFWPFACARRYSTKNYQPIT